MSNTTKPANTKSKAKSLTYFALVNEQGEFWQKWTGASISGRPKWVADLNPACLFANEKVALKAQPSARIVAVELKPL